MNPITIPLLNPNEPEALLAEIFVQEGQQVSIGDLLCTLETTKSSIDIEAEYDGFLLGLQFSAGDKVLAGDILCYVADSLSAVVPKAKAEEPRKDSKISVPENLRISKPALELVQKLGLNIDQFESGPLITKKMVYALHQEISQDNVEAEAPSDPASIIIYGSGGHGKSVLEMLRTLDTFDVVGFLDDGLPAGEIIMGMPILGGGEILEGLYQKGVRMAINAVGGIGNVQVRKSVFQRLLAAKFVLPPIVHPTAFIEPSAELSPGVQIFPHAYVGSDVKVGFGCIINTGAVVSHDCLLDDLCNISPGSILAGDVKIGYGVLIGMGVTVNLSVEIGNGAQIGNSATIKDNLPANGVVRAGTIWPRA